MYIEIDEETIEKIEKITITDYEARGNLVPAENIEGMIEDLLNEIDSLNEKIEDMEGNNE